MSVDPEEAIEKLAEYRATSKPKSKTVETDPDDGKDSIFRRFFLKYYWVNATIVSTLIFTLLIGGWSILSPIWIVSAVVVLTIFLRQTFSTLNRLEVSLGRNTTLDDVIVVLLIDAMFFLFSLFEFVPQSTFITIHVGLTVIWLLQILFVNYLKPKVSHAMGHGIIEEEKETELLARLKLFLTPQRSAVLLIALLASVALNLVIA